jgi:hypothetical protein
MVFRIYWKCMWIKRLVRWPYIQKQTALPLFYKSILHCSEAMSHDEVPASPHHYIAQKQVPFLHSIAKQASCAWHVSGHCVLPNTPILFYFILSSAWFLLVLASGIDDLYYSLLFGVDVAFVCARDVE